MKKNKIMPFVIISLLLIVDFLTFHDIFEPHTVKDWLILAVSALMFAYFAQISFKKAK